MIDFEKIGKRMPYRETDQQIDALCSQISTNTINGARSNNRVSLPRRIAFITSAAAALVLAVTATIQMTKHEPSVYETIINSESVAEVLNQMGDDAVESEVYYTLNAMPDIYQ
ncbi:MAG: hypothetical protein ACI308_04430 [Muribaculaceae bacterium]